MQTVDLLLAYNASVNKLNIYENTPLHEAARGSKSLDDENENFVKCMKSLVKKGADVNALNLHRESVLHVACRYGSSSVVTYLMGEGADLLHTNIDGFNCLEVAIEGNNVSVVKYLIEQPFIFELMRNAQLYQKGDRFDVYNRIHENQCCCAGCWSGCVTGCCGCLKIFRYDGRRADTPMRKLIISMPDMAYEVLEKCTKTIGNHSSTVNEKFFDYEFLEDQYSIHQWMEGTWKT